MVPYYDDGQIQIWHGDCRDLLAGFASVDLVLTDPPYGIALQEHGRSGYDWSVVGDEDQSIGVWVLDELRKRRTPRVVFASPKKPWPGQWRQYLVWDKGPAVGGGGDPKTCWKTTWELIQIADTPRLNGSRDSAVLAFWVGQRDYHYHPCQKPVPLLSYLIEKTTNSDAVVLDPFMGSGSTLCAAKVTGRRAVGFEVDEKYCEIAAKRLQQAVLPLGMAAD